MIVKHAKVSAVSDGVNNSLVQPSDWNDSHTITGQGMATLTGQPTNSTTSFADATGLSFAAEAGKQYFIEAIVAFQSSATTCGIKFAVSGPASPTAVAGNTHIPISLVATTHGSFRAYDSGTATASVDTINATLMAKIDCFFSNGSNAGDFKIRFAAETTGTVTLVGGRLRWYEV